MSPSPISRSEPSPPAFSGNLPASPASGRNPAFDRLRGIGAVCVVLLHAPPLYHSSIPALQKTGWGLMVVCQTAVPFFFLLSGWLLGTKWAQGRTGWSELGRTVQRILQLYAPWFAVFLALDVALGRPHGPVEVLRRFAGFSVEGLDTTGYHLWFLPSLVLADILCWCSLKWKGAILPALSIGALLFAGLAWMDFHGQTLPWRISPHEGLNLSLVCVSIGVLLGIRFRTRPPAVSGWVVLLALVGLVVEAVVLERIASPREGVHPFQIVRLAFPALLLLHLVKNPGSLGSGRLSSLLDLLGRHSTGIYVAHLAVLVLVPFESLIGNGFLRDNLVRWPTAIAGSILLSMLLRSSRLSFLRRLVD